MNLILAVTIQAARYQQKYIRKQKINCSKSIQECHKYLLLIRYLRNGLLRKSSSDSSLPSPIFAFFPITLFQNVGKILETLCDEYQLSIALQIVQVFYLTNTEQNEKLSSTLLDSLSSCFQLFTHYTRPLPEHTQKFFFARNWATDFVFLLKGPLSDVGEFLTTENP